MSVKENKSITWELPLEAEADNYPGENELKDNHERDLKPDWKRWLNYQSIVKQIPFFLFLALLAVIYIYNGDYEDKTIRSINRTAKEVKELQHEYKTV